MVLQSGKKNCLVQCNCCDEQLRKRFTFFATLLIKLLCCSCNVFYSRLRTVQEVKEIWQKAPHGGPIPRLGVTPGGRNLYHWIPGVGVPISVP